MKKPREFWIHDFPKNEVTPWSGNPVGYLKYTNVVDLPGGFWPEKHSIHVIESTPLTRNAGDLLKALHEFVNSDDDKNSEWWTCRFKDLISKAEGGDEIYNTEK